MITTKIEKYEDVLQQLQNFIEREKFHGYDPYDTLNSPLPFHWLGKWGRPIAIQIQKRNPVNIRPLIGIKKGFNPKAIGLFLHGYSLMYQRTPSDQIRSQMDVLFQWLKENYTKGYSGYCWGYNFDWASSVKLLRAHSPTIVVSGFIAKGLMAYHEATKEQEALEILESIADFVLKDLPRTEDESELCFSYSTIEKDCCYNASLLGGELLAYLYSKNGKELYKQMAIACGDFVADKQKTDGRWNYSIDLESGKERTQIDFHQGYVIDSLAYIDQYLGQEKYQEQISKGLNFYYQNQFRENGQAIYRFPSRWPADIHNQAQGIISLSRWSEYDTKYQEMAFRIADYSINKMRSPKGYFHYKRYPWVSIKTPFIRWGQAWMFLALNELIKTQTKA